MTRFDEHKAGLNQVEQSKMARWLRRRERQAEEIAVRYSYDTARIERHVKLLGPLDPDVAEALAYIGRRCG